jgi:hypothetical protein
MNARERQKQGGLQKLTQVLEEAMNSGADSVSLEYEDNGLEVCYMFGNVGIGAVLIDRDLEAEVVGYIVEAAKLERKSRGKMQMALCGKEYIVTAERYESFGESAFKLKINRPTGRTRDRARGKGKE